MEEINNDGYQDTLRIGVLYNILDQALVMDPKIASAAKDFMLGACNYVTDETYIWNRYGIHLKMFKCWVKDRKLFDSHWQRDISAHTEELMNKR